MLFGYFRLSDKAIRDQKRYANEAPKAIETLYERLNHFASRDNFLVSTRNPANSPYSIKRLKCKTMAWRHRWNDNHRTVFTLSEYENQITVVILRSSPRAEVYKGLEKYLTIDKKNLDDWRRIASDELQNEDDILDNNVPSENQIISIFTNQGGNDNFYVEKSRLRIHQLKGAAGTGKTTSIFQLAYESIDNNVYPIIIVPNQSIQNYGIKYFGELPEKKLICNSLDSLKKSGELPNYDLAILTREHLLQHLAGDSQEAFSSMVGNIKIRQILTERRVKIPKSSENINLYNLYLGINSEAYNQSDKDIILRELEESETYKFMIDRNHQSLIQQAFQGLQGRDIITQAERIQDNLYRFIDVMSRILGNDLGIIKSPVLMIDEVQDFYWCQLKVILDFYQTCFPMSSQIENATLFSSANSGLQITARAIAKDAGRLVVIAGDNNQRVTFSGFSWANFATSFRRDFPNNDKDSLLALENFFNINYRNTNEINLAANYLLSAQRTEIKAFSIDNFSGISWIDTPPSDSKRKKLKPQLIEINEHLIEKFTIKIGELKEKNNSVKMKN